MLLHTEMVLAITTTHRPALIFFGFGIALRITNTFETEGGGTKVVAIFDGEPGGFFKVGEPILARIAKKQFQARLETAKELLEAQVPVQT